MGDALSKPVAGADGEQPGGTAAAALAATAAACQDASARRRVKVRAGRSITQLVAAVLPVGSTLCCRCWMLHSRRRTAAL